MTAADFVPAGDEPVQTYDERRRRGACSCGYWKTYGVSRAEFARKARQHRGWHARKEGRVVPLPTRKADAGVFADTLLDIANLPTTTDGPPMPEPS